MGTYQGFVISAILFRVLLTEKLLWFEQDPWLASSGFPTPVLFRGGLLTE